MIHDGVVRAELSGKDRVPDRVLRESLAAAHETVVVMGDE